EAAVLCAGRLEAFAPRVPEEVPATADPARTVLGGGALSGVVMVLRSPYLAGIALWVFLLSLAGTFLYLLQANIVAGASDDPAVRTRIFATVDLAVGLLTLAVQFFATGRLIRWLGVGPSAAVLPFVFAAGFAALAWLPAV